MKKTSGYFHIVLNLSKMNIAAEVNLALGLNYSSDPDYTSPSIPQATLKALATTVQTELGTRLTSPDPVLTNTEKIDVDALTRAIFIVKGEVEIVANKKAMGNRAIFDKIINRIGLHGGKAHPGQHIHIFETRNAGKGMIEILTPVERKLGNATYLMRYGITTSLGVLPAAWEPLIPLGNPDVFVGGLPSASIIAVEYAIVIIPPHKKTGGGTGSGTGTTISGPSTQKVAANKNKMVSILPVNSKGKVVITHGTAFYFFSDPIYIVVT